ncbi:MAG: iron-sulfur cluster assembly protein [Bacteroidetes bacterium]|nr:iron-sulfur cluster assembly protein [Bacteroidota bacterium]
MDDQKQNIVETPQRADARITHKVSEEQVWDVLRECYDPEIPVNIVDLGLVYGIQIQEESSGGANVTVRMTLTAPGCGMAPIIAADVKRRVQHIPGVKNASVEIVFDPPWNPSMMSETARLLLNFNF